MESNYISRKPVGSGHHKHSIGTAMEAESVSVESLSLMSDHGSRSPSPTSREHDTLQDYDDLGDARNNDHAETFQQTPFGATPELGYSKLRQDQSNLKSNGGDIGQHQAVQAEKWRTNRRRRGVLSHLKLWWEEIVSCILAAACLFGLVLFLKHFERRESPEWPDGVTLNTVVAVIATVSRALTVIPIAEGLSQVKWNSFARGQRPLADLYAFDQASRGPWGSLVLLLRTRGRTLGISTIAAVVFVSGLITSSLTQATLTVRPPPEHIVDEAIARRSIEPSSPGVYERQDDLAEAAYATIMMRQLDRRDLLYKQLEPRCPVGTCRWEPFNSVGVCASAENTTEKLSIELSDVRNVFPDHPNTGKLHNISLNTDPIQHGIIYNTGNIGLLGVFPTFAWALDTDDDYEAITKVESLDLIYRTLGYESDWNPSPDDRTGPYRAVRVRWQWCVQTLETGVKEGVPFTKSVKNVTKTKATEESQHFNMEKQRELTLLDADETEEFPIFTYTVSFEGLQGNKTLQGRLPSDRLRMSFDKVFFQPDDFDNNEQEIAARRLNDMIEDISLAMTTFLRLDEENGEVRGYARVGGPIVIVRWPFLSLLAGQIFLTAVFLVYVIIDTASLGVEVVKSSNIAELLALEKSRMVTDFDSEQHLHGCGITEKADIGLQGRLLKAEDGWNLHVQRQDMPATSGFARISHIL